MSTALKVKNNNSGNEIKHVISYTKLNDENEPDVIEYEKALYNAFMDRNPNNWLVNNYEQIDNCRFRSKISYNDQGVYIVKKDEKVVMGIAVNYNMKRKLQLEEIGFEVYKNDDAGEGLLFFSDEKELKGENFFEIITLLFDLANKDFHKRKIQRVFFTCSKNLLSMYELFGFFPIQKKIMKNNEEKFLCGYFMN